MELNKYPYPSEQAASTVVDEQAVIILTDSGKVTILNNLGTFVWELSDGTRTIAEIIREIIEKFEVDQLTAESDVCLFLNELIEIQALIFSDNPKPPSDYQTH